MKYVLPVLIFFTGCSASYHIKQGFKKNPVLMAKVTRDSFPCTELFRTDTAFVYTDSTVLIDCPDYSDVSKKESTENLRTQIATTKSTQKVQVKIPVKTVYINRYWEDSTKALIALNQAAEYVTTIQKENKAIEKKLTIAQSEGEKWKGKAQRRGNANLWFVATILGLIAAIVLLIRSKLK